MIVEESLREIGLRHGSDKFTRHAYDAIYEQFMQPVRNEALSILEIGIGGENIDAGGGSLLAWRDYFPNANIFGIDIYDKTFLDGERVKTILCSQTDPAGLAAMSDQFGPFDIVIDDGSHKDADVAVALFHLFPRLKRGGMYFIEDTQTAYWGTYGGSSIAPNCCDTAIRWLKLTVDLIHRGEVLNPAMFPLAADIDVSELHVFHNLSVLRRRPADLSLDSKVLDSGMRQHFLAEDQEKFGKIGALHDELFQDPSKLRALLEKVVAMGGLQAFLDV